MLKSKQANQTKEIESLKEERDHYKRDYKALKQINKTLEKDLLEVKDCSFRCPSYLSVN